MNPKGAQTSIAPQRAPGTPETMGIAWHNVTKSITVHSSGRATKLLDNCTGAVHGGEMVALMGLSGWCVLRHVKP